MISSNLFSRKELVDMIKKSQKTHDGYYYFPRFRNLVLQKGKIKDTGYFYDRSIFEDKMVFTNEELEIFLAKRKKKFDIQLMHFIDTKLKDALFGIEFMGLKDKIIDKDYTLEELIDTSIYIIKYKYN